MKLNNSVVVFFLFMIGSSHINGLHGKVNFGINIIIHVIFSSHFSQLIYCHNADIVQHIELDGIGNFRSLSRKLRRLITKVN